VAESAKYNALSTMCIYERLVAVFLCHSVVLSSTTNVLNCREAEDSLL